MHATTAYGWIAKIAALQQRGPFTQRYILLMRSAHHAILQIWSKHLNTKASENISSQEVPLVFKIVMLES
jgi:hypothetical protein